MPMSHMDAAGRRARHTGMFVPAASQPMCACLPAAAAARLLFADGMPWHGAGDSIIPSAIPDSDRARLAFVSGFPSRHGASFSIR